MSDTDAWRARFERERASRKEAEALLHAKSRELWEANQALAARAEELATSLERLEQAKDTLVQREKLAALGELVAGIAHEINTPLGVAVTAVSHGEDQLRQLITKAQSGQLTRGQLRTSLDEVQSALQMVHANLQRGAALIRSFKKVAVDQVSEESRDVLLGEVLADVIASLAPMLKHSQVELQLQPCPRLCVRADVGAFAQIVTNLVQNACVHAFEGVTGPRLLQIDHECSDEGMRLDVTDNGCGMSPEVQARVFEPFFTTRRGAGGSGLGMHILYNLVTARFKGTIELRSAPGEGTTWTLKLPFGTDALARPEAASATS